MPAAGGRRDQRRVALPTGEPRSCQDVTSRRRKPAACLQQNWRKLRARDAGRSTHASGAVCQSAQRQPIVRWRSLPCQSQRPRGRATRQGPRHANGAPAAAGTSAAVVPRSERHLAAAAAATCHRWRMMHGTCWAADPDSERDVWRTSYTRRRRTRRRGQQRCVVHCVLLLVSLFARNSRFIISRLAFHRVGGRAPLLAMTRKCHDATSRNKMSPVWVLQFLRVLGL